MTTLKLPSQTIINLLICVGGIIVFILLVNYPFHLSLSAMDAEISKKLERIEEQKKLYPVFKSLLKRIQEKEPGDLPFSKKSKLLQKDSANITYIFQQIARKSNLTMDSIMPDVDSLIDDSGYLILEILVRGGFTDLHSFLIRVDEIPSMEHIEHLRIMQSEDNRNLLLKLKIWLARE